MNSILLVDDHVIFRESLVRSVEGFAGELGFDTILQASNGREAIQQFFENDHIKIVILDIQMPEMDGIQTLKAIRKNRLRAKVIILTRFGDNALIRHTLKLGACGFLTKNCSLQDLKLTLKKVLSHQKHFPCYTKEAVEERSMTTLPSIDLSPREFQLLDLIVRGKSNKQIAQYLSLELNTIESYRKALFKKTQTTNGADLTRFAFINGLIK